LAAPLAFFADRSVKLNRIISNGEIFWGNARSSLYIDHADHGLNNFLVGSPRFSQTLLKSWKLSPALIR
jgi:hypothetical protein